MNLQTLECGDGTTIEADYSRRVFLKTRVDCIEILVGSPRALAAVLPLDMPRRHVTVLMDNLAEFAPIVGHPEFAGWGAVRDAAGRVIEFARHSLKCYPLGRRWECAGPRGSAVGATPEAAYRNALASGSISDPF